MDRAERQVRSSTQPFQTRDGENGKKYISGYFAVFNSNYELWPGATESIDPHAFDEELTGDIRCLIDHKTRLVIGRTKSGTLTLKVDDIGLWGEVEINPADQDALNLYERVKRGDVDQCSFGFEIVSEEFSEHDGVVHWTIKQVRLYPVYEVRGTGECVLSVNGKEMTAIVQDNMIIDTDLMIARRLDKTVTNTAVTGWYEDLYLKPGENNISISDKFELKIIPRWRCL